MRRLLLGSGIAVVLIGGFLAFRHEGRKEAVSSFDAALASLPPGTTATHGAVAYDPVTGTLTVHGFAMAKDGKPLWSASHLQIEGADQQALRDVFDADNYKDGKPAWTERRRLAGHLEADDITIPLNDPKLQPAQVKRISLDGVYGRPFALPPTQDNLKRPDFRADAALAFAVKAVALETAYVASAETLGEHATIGSTTLSGYDGGHVDGGALHDMALQIVGDGHGRKEVSAKLGSLSFKSLDTAKALALVQQGSHDQQSELAALAVASADLADLRLAVAGGPLVSVASVHTADVQGAGSASSGSLQVRNFEVAMGDMAREPNMAVLVAALGGDTVVVDVDLVGRSERQAQRLIIDRYDLDFHNLGTLRLSGTFSAMPLVSSLDPAASPMAKAMAVAQGKIDRAKIAWEDRGLANRLLALAAGRAHSTPEQIKAQLALPLATLAIMMPDQPDAADQVGAFLRDPKTLTISAQPATPVSFLDVGLADWPTRAHLLGLRVAGQ